jgi:hypothetical protein
MSWQDRGLCVSFPGMPWLAEPWDRAVTAERAMGVVCVACPVSRECAQFVAEHGISSGFWAGVDRTPSTETEGVA